MSKNRILTDELESLKTKAVETLSVIGDSQRLVETFLDIMNAALDKSNAVYGYTGEKGKIFRIGVTTLNKKGVLAPIRVVRQKALAEKMFLDTFFLMPLANTSLQPLLDSMKGDYINDMEEHLRLELAKGRVSISSQICLKEKILSNMRFPYRTRKNEGFIFFSGNQKGIFNDLLLDFTQHLIPVFETSLEVCNDIDALIASQEKAIRDKGVVTESFELLRYIQKKLEPDENPFPEGSAVEVFHRCFPWEGHPSGDLLNIWNTGNGRYGVLISDVTGHGKEAGMITIFLRGLFMKETSGDASPSSVMSRVHQALQIFLAASFENPFALSATTIYGILDLNEGTFTYCNAGHNPQFHLSVIGGNVEFEELRPTTVPLGMPFDEKFEEQKVVLKAGDTIIFYTDGITEAMNARDEQFGGDRLMKIASENIGGSLSETGEKIINDVKRHMDGEPEQDDMTLMLLRLKSSR